MIKHITEIQRIQEHQRDIRTRKLNDKRITMLYHTERGYRDSGIMNMTYAPNQRAPRIKAIVKIMTIIEKQKWPSVERLVTVGIDKGRIITTWYRPSPEAAHRREVLKPVWASLDSWIGL